MPNTVLILGASGKIGTHSARSFAAAGWKIRRFNRDHDNMIEAAQGVDVILNGMNPPNYHDWANLIPALTQKVIAAAKSSGATVLLPGNVYPFGKQAGPWSESTPHHPCARKGRIRVDMLNAYRQSGVQTVILRAGDFIDPDHQGDIMSVMLLRGIAKGKITAPGPTDRLHAYAYLPDWARAAVALAEKRTTLARFEDIPFPGHAFTLDHLRAELEKQLFRPLRFTGFPWWALRLAGPVWELARELSEMRYLWQVPHSLSAEKFNSLLPTFEPTPLADVLRAALPADIDPN
ncbi:NAD-dependent epimerase/dehydratase family protein [Aquicoccus sp. G2-2]|uniref:NAD-dependent epimerase/dehydratase family protein n=1 Tax=Aquicoccus sp. G2-2 TaxID=3092120 RepID=UPI002ADF565B|nr:NAD-dependent epimerase/dehydratase family protein [Aquicoccus sp. G2-2]MEA1114022.1 epimerase [Aquicoccus sp. G2-2]